MVPLSIFLSATFAAAPVPKDAGFGRITIWVGNELVSMMPDGTDVKKSPAWKLDGLSFPSQDSRLCPDLKTLLVRRRVPAVRVGDKDESRLTIVPLEGDRIDVEGIHPGRFLISPGGSTLYITGKKTDDAAAVSENWTYDVATKKLAKLPLPERKVEGRLNLDAVSPDGKTFLLGGPEKANDVWEWRNYLVSDGGKTSHPLLEANCFAHDAAFSPDGDRIAMRLTVHDSVDVRDTGAFAGRQTSSEHVVLDVATRVRSRLPKPPIGESYSHLAWSSDGKQLAFVCRVPQPPPMPPAPAPAPPPVPVVQDYRVYVMNADGTKPVEIHKLTRPVRGLVWK